MSTIFISESADEKIIKYLSNTGYSVVLVRSTDLVYPAISSHPDIYLCYVDGVVYCSPGLKLKYLHSPSNNKFVECSQIGNSYPEDIKYNASVCGRFFIHNIKYTEPELLRASARAGLTPVNVSQGYTKCSTVIVDNNSLISADPGIISAASEHGIDVLQISPGNVALTGFAYGFLGGASGMAGDKIIFNGDLSRHPDFLEIYYFIISHGKTPIWFPDYDLTDIGSIICIP